MSDEQFMKLAIEEARKASFPIGCVLVKDNEVIAKGRSSETETFDPTAHAEMNAIRSACSKLKSEDLTGTTLYCTCEPCPMCFSASWWANISKIVYGISLEDVDKKGQREILVPCEYLNEKGGNKIEIVGGFMKEECMKLVKKS